MVQGGDIEWPKEGVNAPDLQEARWYARIRALDILRRNPEAFWHPIYGEKLWSAVRYQDGIDRVDISYGQALQIARDALCRRLHLILSSVAISVFAALGLYVSSCSSDLKAVDAFFQQLTIVVMLSFFILLVLRWGVSRRDVFDYSWARSRPMLLKICVFIFSFQPLQPGFIWWWVLYLESFVVIKNITGGHDSHELTLSIFAAKMAEPAVIAVLIFIAENLIERMTDVKSHVATAIEGLKGFATRADALQNGMVKNTAKTSTLTNLILSESSLRELLINLDLLKATSNNIDNESEYWSRLTAKGIDLFRVQFTEFVKNIAHQIELAGGASLSGMLAQTIAAGIMGHKRVLNTSRKVIWADWRTLTKMAHNIISSLDSCGTVGGSSAGKVEIYTLYAGTPQEFIERNAHLAEWSDYINLLMSGTLKNVKVKRYFVCREGNDYLKPECDANEVGLLSDISRSLNERMYKISRQNIATIGEGGAGYDITLPERACPDANEISLSDIISMIPGAEFYLCPLKKPKKGEDDHNREFLSTCGQLDIFAVRVSYGTGGGEWKFALRTFVPVPLKEESGSLKPPTEPPLAIEILYDIRPDAGNAAHSEYAKLWSDTKSQLDRMFVETGYWGKGQRIE